MGSTQPLSSRRDRSQTGTRLALVTESPLANRVTSWPAATSSSVRYDTTRSVPPYIRGGTLSYNGAICAIRTGPPIDPGPPRTLRDHLRSIETPRHRSEAGFARAHDLALLVAPLPFQLGEM